jgi:hypothetical protein
MPARKTSRKVTARPAAEHAAEPMRFLDFAIRAWREGPYLQVIAHETPAGSMRQPAATRLGVFSPDDYRLPINVPLRDGAVLGRELARVLFPQDVWRLFGESLQTIGARPNLGLRLRLCLDDDLIDLPWEYLYRRDVDTETSRSGFFLADERISLVREPASVAVIPAPEDGPQHGLFLGTLLDDGSDVWGVEVEYDSLNQALRPVKGLLSLKFERSNAVANVEKALAAGCSVFHYAGHIDLENGRGAMVQLAKAAALRELNRSNAPDSLESLAQRASWAWSDGLAPRLAQARTRLAVFNACNSGFWPFVRPLLRAGVPAVVGVQGLVSNIAALNFAEKLYKSLAVGLSLDEAMTFARLYVMDPARSHYDCDWGRFMVYMPSEAAVLFPRTENESIRKRQQQMRSARAQTVQDVHALAEKLDGAGVSRMLSDIATRSVLILGRFTDERKEVLDAIRSMLSTPPRRYVPILFDFEKPGERDLIESIVRFAAVSRFVIADLSDPKSVPAELQAIVPQFPSLPLVPIIHASQRDYPVSDHILRRDSVSKPIVRYRDVKHLLSIMDQQVLAPAEALYGQLRPGAWV